MLCQEKSGNPVARRRNVFDEATAADENAITCKWTDRVNPRELLLFPGFETMTKIKRKLKSDSISFVCYP
jgi:hypothetical protein